MSATFMAELHWQTAGPWQRGPKQEPRMLGTTIHAGDHNL